MTAKPYGHKDRYYEADLHGPVDSVPLDRGYCVLAGSYVICPAARDKTWCTRFKAELRTIKHTVLGIYASPAPIQVPLRLKECKDNETIVRFQLESALKGEEDDESDGREKDGDGDGEERADAG